MNLKLKRLKHEATLEGGDMVIHKLANSGFDSLSVFNGVIAVNYRNFNQYPG